MIRRVACSLSGGVDSALSAFLLKEKGFDVIAVYQKNWDELEEGLDSVCETQDYLDATLICKHLGIDLIVKSFIKEYWHSVFSYLIDSYRVGLTPNPDILCNQRIKFDVFFKFALEDLRCDAIATGHYASSSHGLYLESAPDVLQGRRGSSNALLMRPADKNKDQTFFLSRIPQEALRRSMFPIGCYRKEHVRQIAEYVGLPRVARKCSSKGICFVGKKKFGDFIDNYIEPTPGDFVDYDSGEVLGSHAGIHHYTTGQRTGIGGLPEVHYVVSRCPFTQTIKVARGRDHPALFSSSFVCNDLYWIAGSPPSQLVKYRVMEDVTFKFQHTDQLCPVRLQLWEDGKHLSVMSRWPHRALTPGQFAVFYRDDQCLGSAMIANI